MIDTLIDQIDEYRDLNGCRINPPEAVRIITESDPRGDWFGAEGAQVDLPDMEPENDSDET